MTREADASPSDLERPEHSTASKAGDGFGRSHPACRPLLAQAQDIRHYGLHLEISQARIFHTFWVV
jgi:hypothetical protein